MMRSLFIIKTRNYIKTHALVISVLAIAAMVLFDVLFSVYKYEKFMRNAMNHGFMVNHYNSYFINNQDINLTFTITLVFIAVLIVACAIVLGSFVEAKREIGRTNGRIANLNYRVDWLRNHPQDGEPPEVVGMQDR